MSQNRDYRYDALDKAVERSPDVVNAAVAREVVKVAALYYQFLRTTMRLVTAATIDGIPVVTTGGIMPQTVNATVDNTTVTLVALPEDDHNDPTADQLTWTNDDTASAVATWALSADSHTYTGTLTQAEGTVNITVTDPSAPALSPTEVQLVVGAGATSQIQVTATVA